MANKEKIGIIGVGTVGSTIAYSSCLLASNTQLLLYDTNNDLAKANELELQHVINTLKKDVSVKAVETLEGIDGCDLVVITAGQARSPEFSTRDKLINRNIKIVKELAEGIKQFKRKPFVIMVTNPVDLMTYAFYRFADYKRNSLVGMGNILDSARNLGSNVTLFGEHGLAMLALGKKTPKNLDHIYSVGFDIITKKGYTNFGPASGVSKIIKMYYRSDEAPVPLSLILKGEYGIDDIAVGIRGHFRDRRVYPIIDPLDKQQSKKLQEIADDLKLKAKRYSL